MGSETSPSLRIYFMGSETSPSLRFTLWGRKRLLHCVANFDLNYNLDQEYMYFMGSETLTCYILSDESLLYSYYLSDESSTPLYSTSNGYNKNVDVIFVNRQITVNDSHLKVPFKYRCNPRWNHFFNRQITVNDIHLNGSY